MDAIPRERAKRSPIMSNKGIALAQLGKVEVAKAAYEFAIENAKSLEGSWEGGLYRQMQKVEDQSASDIWKLVIS